VARRACTKNTLLGCCLKRNYGCHSDGYPLADCSASRSRKLDADWETDSLDETKATVRVLANRGLLEPLMSRGRFQLPAVLALHVKSLLTETE
jgi:hypothetical protein